MSNNPTSPLCVALEKALPGKLFYPGSSPYNASQNSFFVAQQSQLTPACIVRPTTSHDVAIFMKTLRVENLPLRLAIRGGGHSTLVGSSNIKGGITLDMRGMNNISLQENGQIVSVGAGAVWGDVYSELSPLNLSVVGGHGYDVGVAGFTLGGGISPFSPRYGFGCDMVSNFSVVLANGDIVNANAGENPDLMVALKGGLNNFGIVVRFDMKVFQQGKIWGGYIVTPITALDANLAALVSLCGGGNWNPYVAVEQSFTFSAERGGLSIVNNIEFTDPTVEEPSELKPFKGIKPTYRNTMRLASLSEIAKENQQLQSNGIRQTFCTTSFYLDLEHLKAVYSIFHALLPSIKEIQGMRSTLTYRCLHPSMPSKTSATGGNSTGLGTPAKVLVVCVLTSSWSSISDDEQMGISARKFIENVDARSKGKGFFYPWKYLNYAAGFQDPMAGLAEGMIERLRAVSGRFDPEGTFQTLVPGGFKLFN